MKKAPHARTDHPLHRTSWPTAISVALAAPVAALTLVTVPTAARAATVDPVPADVTVDNPSFETGWTSAGPTGWQLGGVGSGSATITSSSTAHSGTRSAKLTVSSLAAAANRKIVSTQKATTSAPRVVAGHRYRLSAWYQASTPPLMSTYYHDSSGWHFWAQSSTFPARSTWGTMTYTTGAVPNGADAVSFGATLTTTGWVLLDDAAVTDAPVPAASSSTVNVSTSAQLTAALTNAVAGQTIVLADGTYSGHFTLARSGTATAPIRITGSRAAVLDGGDTSGGYALHLDGADHVQLDGFSITNAQKALVLDASSHCTLSGLDLHLTGEEILLLRNFSRDNVISDNEVHDSGHTNPGYGEGVYIGLSQGNWSSTGQSRTGGAADTSDRNQVVGNHIYDTTAENIDIKEGTTGGLIAQNTLDGRRLSGANYADSWIDVAGNGYTVRSNTGLNPGSKQLDGFQTHRILTGWANDNVFTGNVLTLASAGYGINIQTPANGNTVRTDNTVTGASRGLTNIPTTP